MAFIKCPECGKRFSETEHTCPYCGYLLENQQEPQQETHSIDQSLQHSDNLQLNNQQFISEQDGTSKPVHQREIVGKQQPNDQPQSNYSPLPNFQPQPSFQQQRQQYVKCHDCGKIYDTALEACPQCGCPTEQQLLPPKVNMDDNTPIDPTEIFNIKEDKFEETKDIWITTREILSTSIDDTCRSLRANSPKVSVAYHVEKGVGQLLISYNEYDFLEKIESIHDKNLADKYGWACRRMIINIDDSENIRLDLENNESLWDADFPITQELFLKCCTAKKLEFKITKENGASVVVNGYYGFDPETRAEIDVNGDVVPENDLILSFQALYNYVIDSNMFKDALQRRQMLDDMIKKKNKVIDDELMREAKYEENQQFVEEQVNKNTGVVWLVIGILSIIVGLVLLIHGASENENSLDDGIGAIVIGAIMLIIGPIIAVYGGKRMKGLSSSDALQETVSNMN